VKILQKVFFFLGGATFLTHTVEVSIFLHFKSQSTVSLLY